jgi:H+-translocating NAD(P) transhydrogenase subunit alpha
MTLISILSIFVMACFVGYYVVWSVAPVFDEEIGGAIRLTQCSKVVNATVLG